MTAAVHLITPSDGTALINPLGGKMILKLSDQDSHGAYSIHENILPANSPGPRPHIHHRHDELFYILVGELTLRAGAQTVTATPGSFVLVPRGVVHQPSNRSAQPTHVLLIFSPSGMERFFLDAAEQRIPLQAVSTDPAILDALAGFARKYSFEFADFAPGPAGSSV
jgi:mannose-6-phosphate isomerase-like protein (cupin superfamily)